MTWIRPVRWIAVTAVIVTAAVTFPLGAQAFAARGEEQCQPRSGVGTVQGDRSWRTGGLRTAGCRAWRHIHHHRLYARTSSS
jgi:hypothetical protein